MTFDIAVVLLQDGIANGAIYVLLAVVLVLVFSVTRIVLVPQGDFVTFSALTCAALERGVVPGTVWIVAATAAGALILDLVPLVRQTRLRDLSGSIWRFAVLPAAAVGLTIFAASPDVGLPWKIAATCGLMATLGPALYRVVFQPIASASPLILLVAAIAVHFGATSLGLHVFGPEGVRTTGFEGDPATIAGVVFTRQSVGVILSSLALVAVLFVFFSRSLSGKALLAAAHSRRGAELVGISAASAGRRAFFVAGLVAAITGLLVGPMTTLYVDSGFILALKGFVGAIIGGLAVYPLAAAGALLVGVVEAFASFEASAYRDLIVFTLILPVLVWRSHASPHPEEETE